MLFILLVHEWFCDKMKNNNKTADIKASTPQSFLHPSSRSMVVITGYLEFDIKGIVQLKFYSEIAFM